MATRETPEAKDAILRLGRSIAQGRVKPSPPEFLKGVSFGSTGWSVRVDRTAYFYNHLVLNSLFYLSHENILDLGPHTETVHLELENRGAETGRKTARLLLVRYEDEARASRALEAFKAIYLRDIRPAEDSNFAGTNPRTFMVEDGWMGFRRTGRRAALVFACPDRDSVLEILEHGLGFRNLHQDTDGKSR